MHSIRTIKNFKLRRVFVGFLERENHFLTTGYRILGRRLRPEIQPGDLPRSLGS